MFCICFMFLNSVPLFESFSGTLDQNRYIFLACLQVSFSGYVRIWIWINRNRHSSIWHAVCCIKQLLQKLEFSWLQNSFFLNLGVVGTSLHDSGAPGGRVWIWCLFMATLRRPRSCDLYGGRWGSFPGLLHVPGSLKSIPEVLRHTLGVLRRTEST